MLAWTVNSSWCQNCSFTHSVAFKLHENRQSKGLGEVDTDTLLRAKELIVRYPYHFDQFYVSEVIVTHCKRRISDHG